MRFILGRSCVFLRKITYPRGRSMLRISLTPG